MSDILNASLAMPKPLQQIHPRTMHSHTRHPVSSLSHLPEKKEKRKNVHTSMWYVVSQIHQRNVGAGVGSEKKKQFPLDVRMQ
jgi:hypothetical protein